MNGAVDMGTADIPNINEGWGRINVTQVISPSADVRYYDQTHLFTETGQQWPLVVGIMDPTKPAKITLTWSDAPGAVGANPALVNNLDLQVTNNGNTYLGNVFTSGWSATGGTADTRHNTENVYIQNPTGDMTIVVAATNIAGDGVPYNGDATDQDFALVCYNCALEPDFSLLATPASYETCTLTTTSVEYNITVGSIMSFTDQVDLSVLGNPAGTVDTLSDDPVTPPGSSALTIVIVGPVVAGSYDIDIIGTATTRTHTTTVGLDLYTATPTTVTLTSPADGATDIGLAPTLTWTADANATSYDVEVATDMAFSNIVFTDTVAVTSANLTGLSAGTTYYWRVTPNNACGAGATSAVFSFTTAVLYCGSVGSLPDDPDQTFTLNIADAGEITDLDVSILADHTYVGDTIFTLVHQDTGTSVTMIDRPGRTTTGFGCANNNIDVLLSDEGGDGPVENQCAADPALFGSPTPNNPLSAFDGEDLSGTWLLQYTDAAGGDTGTLTEWCLVPTYVASASDVTLSAATTAQNADAGTTITYTIDVENTGSVSDTYDLTVNSSEGWTVTVNPTSVQLGIGESDSAVVSVEVPANAAGGTVDTTTATATSQSDPLVNDTLDLLTTVNNPALEVDPTSLDVTLTLGDVETYSIDLNNVGGSFATYEISEVDGGGPALLRVITQLSQTATQARSATAGQMGFSAPVYVPRNPQAVIFTEDFEGGTVPPVGWTEQIANAGFNWKTHTFAPHAGTFAADVEYDPALVPQDEWLISSEYVLDSGTLSFWSSGSLFWCRDDNDNCDLEVWLVVGPTAGDANDIYVGTADGDWPASFTWVQSTFDLTSLLPNEPVRIGFRYVGVDGAQVSLDDILLDGEIGSLFDIPWLSESPITGTVPVNGSSSVDLIFDTTVLTQTGVYTGLLEIASDDPASPILFPVTLTVSTAGVDVGPNAALSGGPAEIITYTVAITNTGVSTDTYNLSLAGSTWITELSVTDITLMAGEMGSFDVTVEVPAGAWAGDWDAVTVMATSQADNGISDWAELTTTAEAVYGFDWSADMTGGEGAAGETVTYTISLTNTGNTTDTFNIALAGHSWATTASDSILMLAPGESADFTVSVTIDAGAVHPATDIVTVTATSAGDGNVTDNVALTTAVEEVIVPATPVIYLPMIMRP